MIRQATVAEAEVFNLWRNLEGRSADQSPQPTILNSSFPAAVVWHRVQLESADLHRIRIIPANDLGILSSQTYRLSDARDYYVEHFERGTYDPEHPYHTQRLTRLLSWEERRSIPIVLVSDILLGPLTIIDGNHRAILLAAAGELEGAPAYVGVHVEIRQYSWARQSFE